MMHGDRPQAPGADAAGGVIPYRNSKALESCYCGIFSILPFIGFITGLAGRSSR